MNNIKRIMVLLLFVLIPNIVLEIMTYVYNYFYDVENNKNNWGLAVIVLGLLFGVFIYGSVITTVRLKGTCFSKNAYLVSLGYFINIVINCLPIVLDIPVPMTFSFTYLLHIEWYAVMIGLVIMTFLLGFKKAA